MIISAHLLDGVSNNHIQKAELRVNWEDSLQEVELRVCKAKVARVCSSENWEGENLLEWKHHKFAEGPFKNVDESWPLPSCEITPGAWEKIRVNSKA